MPNEVIGSAFIDVRARLTGFEQQIRSEVQHGVDQATRDVTTVGTAKLSNAHAVMGKKAGSALRTSMMGPIGQVKGLLGNLGVSGGLALTAGVGVAVGGIARLSSQMQTSIAAIASSANISVAQAQKIGDAFLKTAESSTFSANDMASAFAQVAGQLEALNGHALSSSQSLAFMRQTTQLAEASGTDLATTTSSLASIMQTFHMSLHQAAVSSDELFNSSRLTGSSVIELAKGAERLKAHLGPLAPSLNDVATLSTLLGEHGLRGARSMLIVNAAFTTLTGGSKGTTAALAALGVHVFNEHGQFVGLRSVIEQLHGPLAKMTEQHRLAAEKMLLGSSAARVLDGVIQQGTKAYDKTTQTLSRHNTVQQAAERVAHTLAGTTEMLRATVSDLAVKIGNAIIPVLKTLANDLLTVINFVERNKTEFEILGAALLAMVVTWKLVNLATAAWKDVTMAATVISRLFTSATEVQTAATEATNAAMAANPIGLIITLIAGLIAVVIMAYRHFKIFREIIDDVGRFFKRIFMAAFNWVKHAIMDVVHFFTDNWHTIWHLLKTWGPVALAVLAPFIGIPLLIYRHWSAVEGWFKGIWNSITGFFVSGINDVIKILNFFIGVADDVLGFFHLPKIPLIPLLGGAPPAGPSGPSTTSARGGGRYASAGMAEGGWFNRPTAIVGEGNSHWPEAVIPTDPAHRRQALALYQQVGMRLMQSGGNLVHHHGGGGGGGGGFFGNLWHGITHIIRKIASVGVDLLLKPGKAVLDQMIDVLPRGPIHDLARGIVDKLLGGVIDWVAGNGKGHAMAAGGWLGDSVPAMLTPGEFVVNKRATQHFLPLLSAINGYQTGGVVGHSGPANSVGAAAKILAAMQRDAMRERASELSASAMAAHYAALTRSFSSRAAGVLHTIHGLESGHGPRNESALRREEHLYAQLRHDSEGFAAGQHGAQISAERFAAAYKTAEVNVQHAARTLRLVLRPIVTSIQGAFSQAVTTGSDLPTLSDYKPGYGGLTVAGMEQKLRYQIRLAKTFAKEIKRLAKLGLDPALLLQLVQAGPQAGGAIAAELLADPSQIMTINQLEKELSSFSITNLSGAIKAGAAAHPRAHHAATGHPHGHGARHHAEAGGSHLHVHGDIHVKDDTDIAKIGRQLHTVHRATARATGHQRKQRR